ncbi:hypothetical protein PVAP13_8NG085700 [Panicum virgatum]|uniref:Uncharacterized protein n=1 Tax=Panicum virgatum TaxID=38727 RepID=A0A8T0P575_PANVG|nr:hypothetical protein PVAP13_8NG085700 [Panicum virgatum]
MDLVALNHPRIVSPSHLTICKGRQGKKRLPASSYMLLQGSFKQLTVGRTRSRTNCKNEYTSVDCGSSTLPASGNGVESLENV